MRGGIDRKAVAVLVAALLVTATFVAGCAPRSADEPAFRLTDSGSIAEVTRVEGAWQPTGYVGGGVMVYRQRESNQTDSRIQGYALETGETTEWVFGSRPSLCDTGLYYFHNSQPAYITGPDQEPTTIGVSGYTWILASPGNKWLVLYNEGDQNTPPKLALNDREKSSTTPIAWSAERDARHPSWAGDDRLYVDAVAPDGSAVDRAVYVLTPGDSEGIYGALVKLAATEPAENGDGLLACLEMDGGPTPSVAVYDLDERVRLGVVSPEAGGRFGDLVWVAEDTLAAESLLEDGSARIILYRVER